MADEYDPWTMFADVKTTPPISEEAQAANEQLQTRVADLIQTLPDLDGLQGKSLKKAPVQQVKDLEEDGLIYSDIFRELQIRPYLYARFFNEAVRVERQKHLKDIERGTKAGLRGLSTLFLRGYGYIFWPENSVFTLTTDELNNGEEKLIHIRRGTHEENAKYGCDQDRKLDLY